MALAFPQTLGVHQLPSPQMSEFCSSKPPSVHANHSTINNDPQITQKKKQPSKNFFFHCNSTLMLGMMDGKLGFNKGKFVGL